MTNQLFLNDLTDILKAPANDTQLTAAVLAHKRYLKWQDEPTMQHWKQFLRWYFKINKEQL